MWCTNGQDKWGFRSKKNHSWPWGHDGQKHKVKAPKETKTKKTKKKISLFSSPSFKEACKSQLLGKGLTSIKSASTARNMP